MSNWTTLATSNIQRIVDSTLEDIRTKPGTLLFVNRIPSVSAMDGEIMAAYTGRVVVADIIGTDQRAVTRTPGTVTMESTTIPTIKHGEHINTEMLYLLDRINRNVATTREANVFADYVGRRVADLVTGVLQREEVLLLSMLQDAVSYDKLGIQFSGSWGAPSECKVTISTAWTNTSSATPITDILTARNTVRNKYGIDYNRVTMTLTDFLEMLGTAQVQNMIQVFNNIPVPSGFTFPTAMAQTLQPLVSRILGMDIELYDMQYGYENNYGTVTYANYLPEGKILLTDSRRDNAAADWDWANGELLETQPGMVPSMIGGFSGAMEGPVGYATAGDPQGNPPSITLWAAARGFPRRHNKAVACVLTNP